MSDHDDDLERWAASGDDSLFSEWLEKREQVEKKFLSNMPGALVYIRANPVLFEAPGHAPFCECARCKRTWDELT